MNLPLLLFAKKIDLNVIEAVPSFVTPYGVKIATVISNIGSTQSLILLTIALCMFFWLFKKPYHLIQFLITLSVGFLSVYLLKIITARLRPPEALIAVNGYSFPSGHATIVAIFCFLVIFAYKNHIKNTFLKLIFIIFFTLSALAVAFSRIYLSVHYLSDVVGGILLGLFISSLSVFIFENFYEKDVDKKL